jgi:HEAT repeat protein
MVPAPVIPELPVEVFIMVYFWRLHHHAAWLIPLAFGFMLGGVGTARADRLREDPVEELRLALRIPVVDPLKNPDELAFRRQNLAKKILSLKTIGELRRALALNDWLDGDENPQIRAIDRDIRAEVAHHFEREVRSALASANPAIQEAAAKTVGEMGSSIRGVGQPGETVTRPLAPDLAKVIQTGSPAVQDAAARALGTINADPDIAAPAVASLLASQQLALRRTAATALGEMINKVTQLIPSRGLSVTGVATTRADVIRVSTAVVPKLGIGLADADPEVRRLSADAIQQAAIANGELIPDPLKTQRFPPPGRKLSKEERDELTAHYNEILNERAELLPLSTALREQVPALVRQLNSPDTMNRIAACRALEEMAYARFKLERRRTSMPVLPEAPEIKPIPVPDDPDLSRILIQFSAGVEDPEVAVRQATVDGLEMFGDTAKPVAASFVKALGDANIYVRLAAARALGKIGPVEEATAVSALAKLLDDPDLDVRINAAGALERFGPAARAAVPELAQTVNRGDTEIRIAALRGLEGIGTDAQVALPTMISALSQDDPRVRRAAAEVLGRFGALARPAEPALRQALEDSDAEVRKAASDALLNILPIGEK